MATLFERLVGITPPNPSVNETKMPIHAFDGCCNYIGMGTVIPGGYGAITGVEVAGWFNLDAAQQQQMIYLFDLIDDAAAAGVRTGFQRANKDWLYNAEWNTDPMFRDEDAYWGTLQQIITDGGGTPTTKPW